MFLKKISLKNYRKFDDFDLEFFNNYVIILGENATGKTTILEAINVLSNTKTPKNSDLNECVKAGKEYFSISGLVNNDFDDKKMFISYSNGEKKVMINDTVCKKISTYIENFFVVYFQPLDAVKYLILAQNRRNMMDSFICQISNEYLMELIYYKRILKEKNALLKLENFNSTNNNFILLEMINEKISSSATQIVEHRKKIIDKINGQINDVHCFFSNNETACIKYEPNSLKPEEDIPSSALLDISSKTSTRGPHKDDYKFEINGKDIGSFCSQGQQKSFILSLKITMLELFYKVKKTYPILILDDAFSDLDSNRQNAIFKIVEGKCQMFISTTSLKQINEKIVNNSQIIEIKKGDVTDE